MSAAGLRLLGSTQRDTLAVFMADNMESLSGVTAQSMADDLIDGAARWRFEAAAPGLAQKPLLVFTSDGGLAAHTDPLVQRVRALGDTRVTTVHQPTDHSWSDKRIALQTAGLAWRAQRSRHT